MPILANELYQKIKTAFNLPDDARSVTIRMGVDEVVTVKVEYMPNVDIESAEKTLSEYFLEPKNGQ